MLILLRNYSKISQPRGDYKELLELGFIFLGAEPPSGIIFKQPGAVHHARWMAKAIYSLKIFVFRNQFKLSNSEMKGVRQVCIFVVKFDLKIWFSATSAITAPNNDLTLIQDLISYDKINPLISKNASTKMAKHLWYLSEELSVLSLFDMSVSPEIKKKVVTALKSNNGININKKRYQIKERFGLCTDFLNVEITLWPTHERFQNNLQFFNSLKVVNDVAERNIALISQYNQSLTKDEEQFQSLLQTVKKHRQDYPDCRKKTLL
ncbi:uncharacterized protein LOC123258862 [Cotesia glomerata]|uniref:uncharacterized protein LOC123258862 n=1 Tax=Cotesia glomerata TaxID=32391 RepID=UPI001D017EDB|nr:uncharacterized protein LOC123258862 [Cotesia glomerata]